MTDVAARFVGTSVRRTEDLRILTGRGRYVDDVELPGLLHVTLVRSPLPHARITGIDVTAARQAPGVVAVYTWAEVEAMRAPDAPAVTFMPGMPGPRFTVVATDKVRLVGDPVAVVVADSRYRAEDAAELVEVAYDDLDPVVTVEQALDPARPPIWDEVGSNVMVESTTNVHGDVEGAFADATRVVTGRVVATRHAPVPMETRGGVFEYDADTDTFTIRSSNQGVHAISAGLAPQLGVPQERIIGLADEVGGAFGLKIGICREDVIMALVARDLRRPVKWIEDRNEHLIASGQARDEQAEFEAAITDDGEVLGLKVRLTVDAGAYPGLGGSVHGTIERMLPGALRLRGFEFTHRTVATNKATYVAYRGPWAMETFVRERMLDAVAHELGLDPLEVRRRNVVTAGDPYDRMLTGTSLETVTVRESIDRIAEIVDRSEFRVRQEAARAEGRYLGIGLASFIEAAPGPIDPGTSASRETMRMAVDDDGTVLVFTAQMPHGQGHLTTLAQIAADECGVPFEQVKVIAGDTRRVPFGMGTMGSRAATMAGGAALHSARALKAKILQVASHVLEASPDDLELVDGKVRVKGVPVSATSLADVAAAAATPGRVPAEVDAALEAEHVYDGGRGGWSGGTHTAIVEVDVDTGLVHIERYVVVEDCGKLINPAVVEGQVRGGVAQGIGSVLLERAAYDPETGQFLSGTFMDYLLPTTTDVPRIEIEHLETVPLDPDVNYRGVGEGGMIVAPATLVSAIEDALSPFGVRIEDQHLPPLRILELIGAIEPE